MRGQSLSYFPPRRTMLSAMNSPIILSTWTFGQCANAAGWAILEKSGAGIDAVEAACRDAEADPNNRTVGYGGLPDASGQPSLDAAIMLSPNKRGAVAFCAILCIQFLSPGG